MTPRDITEARKALGLTQEELAIRAGVSLQSINRLERGVTVRPDTVKAVCAALDMSYSPMRHIEVLGPEALVAHPSSATLLRTARTLQGIRYVVRVDDREWVRFMRGIPEWGPWLAHVSTDTGGFLPAMLQANLALIAALLALLFSMRALDLVSAHSDVVGPCAALAIQVVLYSLCLGVLLVGLYKALPIPFLRRYRWPSRRLDDAYAFGDDVVWTMRIEGGGVACHRVGIEDRNVSIHVHGGTPIFVMHRGYRDVVTEVFPDHAGLIELVERDRPADSFRYVALEPVAGT